MRRLIWLAVGAVWVFTASCASGPGKPVGAAPETTAGTTDSVTGAPADEGKSRYHPVVGTKGMVVSDDPEASEWGAEILRRGGNAVDAAVATAFMLSVTRPHFAALGGGGFFIFCPKPTKSGPSPCRVIDYRETAPKGATRDMFVVDGKAQSAMSRDGALAPGVPGTVAGLLTALEKFGTRKRAELLSQPIAVARRGVRMTARMERVAYERWKAMNDEARRIFGCAGHQPCAPGSWIKQPDLARVLMEISSKGRAGFYQGWVADRIVEGLRSGGGIISAEDLANYSAKARSPIVGKYRDFEVVSMPPPSAGGTLLVQMLGFAERADRQGALAQGYGSAEATHALAHAMTLGFMDRADHFGDPDFVDVPVKELLAEPYLDARWGTFRADRAGVPGRIPTIYGETESETKHTTHFSVIDREGNAVAITTTVNDDYGSGFVPPGTGIVMNNEMDDFNAQVGSANLFGLVGTSDANAVAAGKRPLSSMTPTIVRDAQGNARLVVGAAGGPRITTSVFQVIVNRLRFGMSLPDAVAVAREHHQWRPNELKLERSGYAPEVRARLQALGYAVVEVAGNAKVHALERFPANGRVWGSADPRGEGAAAAE